MERGLQPEEPFGLGPRELGFQPGHLGGETSAGWGWGMGQKHSLGDAWHGELQKVKGV